MTSAEVQSLLLRVLAAGGDTRLGRGRHYFSEAVMAASPPQNRPTNRQIMEAVWSLIGQGLAYIDYSQPAAENWNLYLTEAGRAAASDEEVTPDDPGGYLRRLIVEIPELTPLVKSYAEEALLAYNARLYRASAVMLGVASEAAVLEVALALAGAMTDTEAKPYLETINAHKQNFVAKFEVFAQKLRSKKSLLPEDLADGLDLTLNAVTDLLRVSRNDAGHPTGRGMDRDDCFIHLRMFVRYARKLYSLKASLQNAAEA
jgi:hypothetical protein